MWRSKHAIYEQTIEEQRKLIAVLREEARRLMDDAAEAREGERAAMDRLFALYGAAPITPAGRRSRDSAMDLELSITRKLDAANDFREVPLGSEEGRFATEEEAALGPVEPSLPNAQES